MSKLVYFAGPYTKPDPVINVNSAIQIAEGLYNLSDGLVVPIIPHLTMFWHLVSPHEYDFWLRYDLKVMEHCDAVYRIFGESSGADGETARAVELEIPVFYDPWELVKWSQRAS